LKRLAIVYGADEDYIREVLSFFTLRELRRGGDREYLAAAWGPAGLDRGPVWSVDPRFEAVTKSPGPPPPFQEAVILALPGDAERTLHEKIAGRLGRSRVRLLNPARASLRADDKAATLGRLAAKNVPVPEFLLLERRDRSRIVSRLDAFLTRHQAAAFYAQPNEGTEGREAYFFTAAEFHRSPGLAAEAVSGILLDRRVIIRKARGNVFFFSRDEPDRGYRPVTFRVFLWRREAEVEADLGFAEVSASSGHPVTSPEQGGRIVPPAEALANLHFREAGPWRRLVLSPEERPLLPETARRALAASNAGLKNGLRIAGVDLVLEVAGGRVRPVVLEINPRPSGLDKLSPILAEPGHGPGS